MIEDERGLVDYEAREDLEYERWRDSLTDWENTIRLNYLEFLMENDFAPRAFLCTIEEVDDSIYIEVEEGVCIGFNTESHDISSDYHVKDMKMQVVEQYKEGVPFLTTDIEQVLNFDNLLEI